MIDANYTADEIKFLQKLMDRYSEDGGIIDLGLDHAAFMSIVRRHYVSREAAAMTNPTPELQTDEALVEEARRICAEHDPDKAYQYLEGHRDDYMPMTAVFAALCRKAIEVQEVTTQLTKAKADAEMLAEAAEGVLGVNAGAIRALAEKQP